MRLSRALLAVPLLLGLTGLLAGCQAILDPPDTPVPSASATDSGIAGVVHLGPTCEGATRASPCIEVYSAALQFLDSEDDLVGELTSATDGSFRITLPPGIYTIQPVPPENGDQFPVAQPLSVVVGEDEYTQVEITYDTGIR
ncbi:MAG: hypothetical protein U0869_11500 [Chloroflexota bacterium]